MNSIDDLVAVLIEPSSADRISQISLTRRELFLLRISTPIRLHRIVSCDWGTDSKGTIDLDLCLWVGRRLVGVTIVEEQEEAFRLWDREGQEVFYDLRSSARTSAGGRSRSRQDLQCAPDGPDVR